MKTYIVIPNYIANDELKELSINAINSFRKTQNVIIVNINDGSPMNCEWLKEMSDVYLENKENQGFAKTCNKGFNWIFENEKDECFIVCANNDIEVFNGWYKAMTEPFDMFDNVAITGLISSRSRIIEGNIPIEKFQIKRITEGGLLNDWMQSGGLWMSKKSILEKVGIFDEQFERGGCEDVDLFLRMRDTFGMKIIMSGMSMFWHKEGATRWGVNDRFRNESKMYDIENDKKLFNKWGLSPHQGIWKSKEIWNN